MAYIFFSLNFRHFNYVLIFLFFQALALSSFDKSCIAPCNAVNSDCILKELITFRSWFVFRKYIMIDFSFIVSPVRGCICKQITHIQIIKPLIFILYKKYYTVFQSLIFFLYSPVPPGHDCNDVMRSRYCQPHSFTKSA